jgi:PiT family inorganic phosphate transporter
MIISAFLVCLSHGSNDVANAISPLVLILEKEGYPNWNSFFIGASGIAIGLLIMGRRVMETVGKDIIILDY